MWPILDGRRVMALEMRERCEKCERTLGVDAEWCLLDELGRLHRLGATP